MADEQQAQSGNPNGGGSAPEQPERKFSQSEVNQIAGERAQRAGEAAVNKLLSDLGAKNADELKAAIESAKQAQQARLSELERAQAQIAALQAEADAARSTSAEALARANARLMMAEIKQQAARANIRDEALPDVWPLIQADKTLLERLAVTEQGEVTGAAEVVADIVKARPHWLRAETKPATGTPPNGQRRSSNETKPIKVGVKL